MEKLLPDERLDYKEAREARENLELPPDLAGSGFDDAMDIPPIAGSATYSRYEGEREARSRIARSGEVLPTVGGVTLERAGDKRWLEIDASPQTVWPKVVAFWRQQGILLEEANPAIGVMKTDWLENRAEIRDDVVTRTLRKVVDGLYATSIRDQYRVRLDRGSRPNTTEVYMTHRSMEERVVRNTVGEGATTVWEPADNDPGKEAAMLRRLMLFLGVSDRAAERMLADNGAGASATSSAPRARLVREQAGSELIVAEEYRRAWRRTGLALDRTGFAVDDRDRSQGVFFVRYDDPNRGQRKRGMLSRMAFWQGKDRAGGVERYQVRLEGTGDETKVRIYNESGQRDSSATATRILGLLEDELR
jgi:outer membrane protein assembly factor BamC